MKTCIKCGAQITHHHSYCEKHYPKKTATILFLSNENRMMKRKLENINKRKCKKCNIKQDLIIRMKKKIKHLEQRLK